MVIEACHALVFQSNILSVAVLSVEFVILFTLMLRLFNGCFIVHPKSLSDPIREPEIHQRAFTIAMTKHERNKQMMVVNTMNTKQELALNCHEHTGHLTSSRYQNSHDPRALCSTMDRRWVRHNNIIMLVVQYLSPGIALKDIWDLPLTRVTKRTEPSRLLYRKVGL